MKKLITLIALSLAISASAQTNGFLSDLGQVGKDAYNFFADANSTNVNWGVTAGGLYSDKQWGGFVDAQYTLVSNTVSTSVGFVGCYIPQAHTFYDGSFSCRLSSTVNVPVIGALGIYAESGPGYDFSTHQVVVQSFTGIDKDILISNKYHLILGGGTGNISDRSGLCYIAHITFIW